MFSIVNYACTADIQFDHKRQTQNIHRVLTPTYKHTKTSTTDKNSLTMHVRFTVKIHTSVT